MKNKIALLIGIVMVVLVFIFKGNIDNLAESKPFNDIPKNNEHSTDNRESTIGNTTNDGRNLSNHKDVLKNYSDKSNQPIKFHGRIVDENNNPLGLVKINYQVTTIPLLPKLWGSDDVRNDSCVSDANGLFYIQGIKGISLSIGNLSKEGYRMSGYYPQGNQRYDTPSNANNNKSENDNTIIDFVMIRDDLSVSSLVLDRQLSFTWNNGATIIDLREDIGKLELIPKRDSNNKILPSSKFNWDISLKSLGFSMAQLSDSNVRVAPKDGYISQMRFGYGLNDSNWMSSAHEYYAIYTKDNKYGLIDIEVYGYVEDGGVNGIITVYLNNGGSRNLDH